MRLAWHHRLTAFQLTAPLREPTCPVVLIHRFTVFQLTAPLREPTNANLALDIPVSRFNSRLPCGSRRYEHNDGNGQILFQLTAPLREPTKTSAAIRRRTLPFQLTAPLREPTNGVAGNEWKETVSTHGSLAGADSKNSHFQETFHKKKNAFSCFSNFFITFFYNIRFDLKK